MAVVLVWVGFCSVLQDCVWRGEGHGFGLIAVNGGCCMWRWLGLGLCLACVKAGSWLSFGVVMVVDGDLARIWFNKN